MAKLRRSPGDASQQRGEAATAAAESRRLANAEIWDELSSEPIMTPDTTPPPPPRGFFRTLFGLINDYLLTWMLVNLLVCIQVFVGVALGYFVAVGARADGFAVLFPVIVGGGLVGAPAFGGLFYYARSAGDPDQRTTLREYFDGMRRYARRSWIVFFVQSFAGLMLYVNLRFYAGMHSAFVALPLTGLIALLGLIWLMAGFYVWPLMVRDLPWRTVLRNAVFLALAAPFSTLGLLLMLTAFSGVLIVSRVLWLLFLPFFWAVTENVALQRLVRIFRERSQAEAS